MDSRRAVERYDDWHRGRADTAEGRPTPTAPWHLTATRHLGDVRGLRVLEIGCGLGAFAELLAERGASLVAADFSPAAVEQAAERLRGYDDATAIVADIEALPFPDESFDLVVSLETLEHVPHPPRGLAELVRVTRLGGRLIVTSPNYFSLMAVSRVLLRLVGKRYTEIGQPVNKWVTLAGRVWRLRRLGCRIEAVEGSHQLFLVPGFTTFRLTWLERPARLARWTCYHGCTVATRLK